eukprot:CAMPEP_0206430104 /NCGR_PEP_ID=MMETSP0324_2-20121206/6626_1 /ASSEMBLY_ACC=CAM_ASM_000836 /TAXON_ID=2866 /ORGANISM="Crypthecodinium cohnii, Strain Seligo" /LENGTH=264 /DNA_ID=CAMNT_0053895889 /DNA_START=92 /DNA_END=886 /DNA_ORIENTATION=-
MMLSRVSCFLFVCLFGYSFAVRDTHLQAEVKVENDVASESQAMQAVRAKHQLKSREATEDQKARVEKRAKREKVVSNSTQLVANREAARAQRMAKQAAMIEAKQKARAEKAGKTFHKEDAKNVDEPKEGDKCEDDSDCEGGGTYLECMPDLEDSDRNICDPYYRLEGEFCNQDDHCEGGLICRADDGDDDDDDDEPWRCTAPKKVGEDCVYADECEEGLYCVRRQAKENYKGMKCSSRRLKAGAWCYSSSECEGICNAWISECQ